MAQLHFEKTPYQRNLFGIPPGEVQGNKFKNWEDNARYSVTMTLILQIETTQVSEAEYNVSPNITFLSDNTAIVNIYKNFSFEGSFAEFNAWYASQESSLKSYVDDLVNRLNAARAGTGLEGLWYINYGLGERHVEVFEPEGG